MTNHERADGAASVGDAARAALILLQLLDEARTAEWQAAPRQRRWESERTSGTRERSDSTADTATDEARLHLRAAVTTAEAMLKVHARNLRAALEPYRGGSDA